MYKKIKQGITWALNRGFHLFDKINQTQSTACQIFAYGGHHNLEVANPSLQHAASCNQMLIK
jgi:hypothetical protein